MTIEKDFSSALKVILLTKFNFVVIISGMLSRLVKSLAGLIYPKICLGCKSRIRTQAEESILCQRCRQEIKRNTPPFCHCCGRHLEKNNFAKNICPVCLRAKLYFDRAFSPCVYQGIIRELIHEFKYKNKDYLGKILSEIMIEFIREYSLPINDMDLILPVPLHTQRLREREFNQADLLSRNIAAHFQKESHDNILRRSRLTKTQTDLETAERFLNVKGSFSVDDKTDLKGKNILLVDDVLTTGATSSEAALALKNAGANIVFVLTLAN